MASQRTEIFLFHTVRRRSTMRRAKFPYWTGAATLYFELGTANYKNPLVTRSQAPKYWIVLPTGRHIQYTIVLRIKSKHNWQHHSARATLHGGLANAAWPMGCVGIYNLRVAHGAIRAPPHGCAPVGFPWKKREQGQEKLLELRYVEGHAEKENWSI
jgi:hypothetical protein